MPEATRPWVSELGFVLRQQVVATASAPILTAVMVYIACSGPRAEPGQREPGSRFGGMREFGMGGTPHGLGAGL